MDNMFNISNIPKEYMYDPDFQSKLKTILIGDAIGCEKIYVNIDYVKPGSESVKYHSHYMVRRQKSILGASDSFIVEVENILSNNILSRYSG